MLIREKLNMREKMSESEGSIASFILTLGKGLKKYSTRNIAEATYTSPATVVRLCKKLDFKGFDDFKEQFLKEIEYLDQQYGRIDANFPFHKEDTMMNTVHKIYQLYEDTIKDSLSLLHHDSLQQVLKLLKYSQAIYIFMKLILFRASLRYGAMLRKPMTQLKSWAPIYREYIR